MEAFFIFTVLLNLNTSHVKVQQKRKGEILHCVENLNTSHVKVQQI